MNFHPLNTFAMLSGAALLTAFASFSSSVLATEHFHGHHLDHGYQPVGPHDHHNIPDMPMQHEPKVNPTKHAEHSKPLAYPALTDLSRNNTGLRSPDYSHGYSNSAHQHMMSSPSFWSFDAEKLELARNADSQSTSGQYALKLWYGNDYNRLYFNTNGEFAQDNLEQTSTSLMWWRPFSTYWNTTLGLKQDYVADSTDPTWLGGGISGLAPYWFDIEANLYGSTEGHSQLELNASYDLNISQKWVLQPEIELRAYGKTSAAQRYGAGLAEFNTGMRLRYEITPQLAPYIGFEHERFMGKTAQFYKDREGGSGSRKILLGLRFWY